MNAGKGRLAIEKSGRTLRWLAYGGEVRAGDRQDFGPDPDTPVDQADFASTVADPVQIQLFMEHFAGCRR